MRSPRLARPVRVASPSAVPPRVSTPRRLTRMKRAADRADALERSLVDAARAALEVNVRDVRSALEGSFDGFFLAHDRELVTSRDAREARRPSSSRAEASHARVRGETRESSELRGAKTPSASAEGAPREPAPRDSSSDGDVGRVRSRWTACDGVGSVRWADAPRAREGFRSRGAATRRYYCSRSYVAKAAGEPSSDTDDEEELADAREDASLIYDFTDFAVGELDFMVKWNFVARRFRCSGEHETSALCERFAETYAPDLGRSEFFNYFLRTMLGMVEFGVLDREGVVRALQTARRVTESAPTADLSSESEEDG